MLYYYFYSYIGAVEVVILGGDAWQPLFVQKWCLGIWSFTLGNWNFRYIFVFFLINYLINVFSLQTFIIQNLPGGFPYPTVSNHELLAYLASGQRLQRPENCSEHLYELMLQCWNENPDDRPEFANIVQTLEPAHQKIYVDFNDLSSDYVFPPTIEQLQNNNLKPGLKSKSSMNGAKPA